MSETRDSPANPTPPTPAVPSAAPPSAADAAGPVRPASLVGKVALVTGAAKRVGRAIALQLAAAGASVAVHYNRSAQPAQQTAEALRRLGVQSQTFAADLADPAAAAGLVPAVVAAMGRLDVLVNSASIFPRTPLDEITDAHWQTNMAVHLTAPWLLCRAALAPMRAVGGGRIVHLVDRAVLTPYRHYLPYIVSKSALAALTRTLALEVADQGITVNGVAPGAVLLPDDFSPDDAAALVDRIPARRIGSPADIAATVEFLVRGPAYITGQIVTVDGGRSLSAE